MAAVLVGAACGAPSAPGGTSEGFFESGPTRLSYALDLPEGDGPFPAVVLGHGSGLKTKDEHRDWSGHLAQRGVAVLRYDKRGVGASEGIYENFGAATSVAAIGRLAADMAAGVAFLRTQPQIDGDRIGLIGPSQAGWIIPAAAVEAGVRFAVIKSGPAIPMGLNTFYEGLTRDGLPIDEAEQRLAGYHGPLGYDPAPVLQSLDIPVFWMLGGRDRSVPPMLNRTVISELIDTYGQDITLLFKPDGDHGMGLDYEALDAWLDDVLSR